MLWCDGRAYLVRWTGLKVTYGPTLEGATWAIY